MYRIIHHKYTKTQTSKVTLLHIRWLKKSHWFPLHKWLLAIDIQNHSWIVSKY